MPATYSHLPNSTQASHFPQSQLPHAQKDSTRTVHPLQPADAHHHHHHQHHQQHHPRHQHQHQQQHHQQHHPHHPHHPLSAPASQESMVSVQSSFGGSSIPQLQGSDSNWSQLTSYTDGTSPSSSAGLKYANTFHTPHAPHQSPTNASTHRIKTPENGQQSPKWSAESAWYSPMSITSPVATNGAKRTASGHVKNAHSITNSPYHVTQFPGRDSRRESLSSSGSKAGEMAATLKARLGYAMAKVQNGWEHKSLAEVEQLAAERLRHSTSMSQIEQQRPGTSGRSNGASKLSMSDQYGRPMLHGDAPPPSKRTSGNYSQYQAQLQQHDAPAPRLQPAPDIRPTSSQRGGPYPAPILQPVPQHVSGAMSPPRTPANGGAPQRPATIRTETQTAEAEREALQALFQLGSPHTSVGPHITRTGTATTNSSQGQMSPTKADLTARHAFFSRSESASTSSSGNDTSAQALQESRTRLIEQLAD